MAGLSLTLTGAEILTPAGIKPAMLHFQDGVVVTEEQPKKLHLPGMRILPGLVDLHGDGFERHLAPRRGMVTDMVAALMALDIELASNGITTAVLAQFWSWEGGMRAPQFAQELADALRRARPFLRTDMRLQLRVEIGLLTDPAPVLDLIDKHQVGYVVFNDHLPRKHLTEGRKPPRLTGQALKSRRSPEEHLALLSELHEKTRDPWGLVEDFARQLALKGVLMGSHDDPSPEIRAKYRTLGVHIAEFPMTEATALAAKEAGDPVILGAPNLVRGGSHNKNLDAKRAIDQGLCSALVSDYHYPALYQSAQKLSEHLRCDIAAAWGLVSHGAAQILGLADRGWLEIGKQADFIVTNQTGRIFASFVAGRPSFVASELVDSFL